MIVCRQCLVYRPEKDVTFATCEEAMLHAIEAHPTRTAKLFASVMTDATSPADLEQQVLYNCRDGEPRP